MVWPYLKSVGSSNCIPGWLRGKAEAGPGQVHFVTFPVPGWNGHVAGEEDPCVCVCVCGCVCRGHRVDPWVGTGRGRWPRAEAHPVSPPQCCRVTSTASAPRTACGCTRRTQACPGGTCPSVRIPSEGTAWVEEAREGAAGGQLHGSRDLGHLPGRSVSTCPPLCLWGFAHHAFWTQVVCVHVSGLRTRSLKSGDRHHRWFPSSVPGSQWGWVSPSPG